MVRKASLILMMVLLLVGMLTGIPLAEEKLYPGVIVNRTDKIVDVAVVVMTNTGPELVWQGILGPDEKKELTLEEGIYGFVASCTLGYARMILDLPNGLDDPNGPWRWALVEHQEDI